MTLLILLFDSAYVELTLLSGKSVKLTKN